MLDFESKFYFSLINIVNHTKIINYTYTRRFILHFCLHIIIRIRCNNLTNNMYYAYIVHVDEYIKVFRHNSWKLSYMLNFYYFFCHIMYYTKLKD